MSWYWFLAGATSIILVVGYYTDAFRYAKSLYLIAITSPYEQVGTGSGRILLLGDSTGYGTGVRDASASVAGRLGADYPQYTIENRSVNGDTIAMATNRVRDLVGQYDVVLLQLGGNDILQKRHVADIVRDLTALYELLESHTDQIVMLSAGNVGGASAFTGAAAQEYEMLSRTYHATVADFAAERPGFTYVSLFDEPADDPFVAEPETYMALDGLHPSEAGYALWYGKLAPVLPAVLGMSDEEI